MARKRPKDWRTGIRSFQEESPTKQSLRATGSIAGQPQGRALRRAGPGCCLWPLPRGPGHLGLQRCRQGELDCLAGTRGQEPGRA
ncbi:MAG: hypothetical protein WCW68_03315 [Methanothrix sp.]